MKKILNLFLLFCFAILFIVESSANISVPEIFSSNMVLQQNEDVSFWGWAKPGETVVIKTDWSDKEWKVKATNMGVWKVAIQTPSAGGPYNIQLKGYNEIILENVLIGEVWVCSGQSNMEWSAQSGIINGDEEIAKANFPEIRFFAVDVSSAKHPQQRVGGKWTVCNPETMKSFSAVGYFFGKKLHEVQGVPIGLINSSWGGTPAEAWMPKEAIESDDFLKEAASLQKEVPWGPVETASIYNAMIAPLVPFKIAGSLWYQGEANTINAYAYTELLSTLIKSWRTEFENDFPFYFAQIAPYKYGNNFDGVEVREAQRRVLELENTGMLVLSDIGDTTDIHPRNKIDVGIRFANLALNQHYKNTEVEFSGPLFSGFTINKKEVIVSFDHSKGLHAKGDKITCFEIAGNDNIFYPAVAKIKDQQVILKSKKVKNPKHVRFAWRNTATPNLFNAANLPTSCFKTY